VIRLSTAIKVAHSFAESLHLEAAARERHEEAGRFAYIANRLGDAYVEARRLEG
jgi:hypothetical protein